MKNVKVLRLLFAVVTFSFAIYLVPGLFGAPLSGISFFLPPQDQSTQFISSKGSTTVTEAEALCGTPKYSDKLHLPYGLAGYFDYEQGIQCAKEKNMPVFIDFKGHSCTNCKKMEAEIWSDPIVLEKLRKEFIIIALYTDDKTKLPEEEWLTPETDGKVKKTMGQVNQHLQIELFNTNTLPLYAVVDHEGNLLTKDYYEYSNSATPQEFAQYLQEGIDNFKKKK